MGKISRFMGKISHKRHIAKTITWRIIGTLDTVLLSWIITGNPMTGLKSGFLKFLQNDFVLLS